MAIPWPLRHCSPMRRIAVGAVVLTSALLACAEVDFPQRNPTMEGVIVGIGRETSFDKSGKTIWVKETPDAQCGIIFSVGGNTFIGERTPGITITRSFEDLAVGQGVRVWIPFNNFVASSCPGQGGADAIEIVSRP